MPSLLPSFPSSIVRPLSVVLAATMLVAVPIVRAQDALHDLAGAKDSPIVSRFAGSTLVGYQEQSFASVALPLSNEVRDKQYVKAQTVEGKVTRLAYVAPAGKSALEVQRNYTEALAKAGFVPKFSCHGAACRNGGRIQDPLIDVAQPTSMKQVASYGGYADLAFLVVNTDGEAHYAWGVYKGGGREVDVAVFTSTFDASDSSPLHGRVGTFVQIVEQKPMDTGQVTVDANAMQKGLAADGKVALYGIYFDTGRADLKPESKPQLDEMAKLLASDRSLKVFIVGHTDNQGSVDANLALSQRRAEAIVAALVRDGHVDASRLSARGVANFAPVAGNDSDAGRARNRRVELVRQ